MSDLSTAVEAITRETAFTIAAVRDALAVSRSVYDAWLDGGDDPNYLLAASRRYGARRGATWWSAW